MTMPRFDITMEPRPYQSAASEWAVHRKQGVCCLPTGTGKTLVGILWLKYLFQSEGIEKAIVLEPTRLLVNQTTEYFFHKASVEGVPIDGRIPRDKRRQLWASAALIVATPETALNDIEDIRADAVVIDECHHTVGQDAFAKVMAILKPACRLGLSAFIPSSREREVTELVGPIKRWSWSDPEIAPYVPNWIGEVYEAHLSLEELSLLKVIRQLPAAPGVNPSLLERYLSRDGSPAVRETLTGKNRLAQAFGAELLPLVPHSMHKLEAVHSIFSSHEPSKAVVFVDRVVIADKVSELFSHLHPVVFKGKRGRFDQGKALRQARDSESHLIVSTSAGEEGVDLPSADLLVIWGNAASDIRFIQRLGRMMRRVGEGLKFATFVVTPESSDFDSFAQGLGRAAEAGAIDVEKTFGWDPEVLWPRTTWWHVSELLRGQPTALSMIENQLQVRGTVAKKVIGHAVRRGRIFYLYDVAQIATDVVRNYLKWDADRKEFAPIREQMLLLNKEFQGVPKPITLARRLAQLFITLEDGLYSPIEDFWSRAHLSQFPVRAPVQPAEQPGARRIYLLTDDASRAAELLPDQLSTTNATGQAIEIMVSPIERGRSGGVIKGRRQILRGFRFWGQPTGDTSRLWLNVSRYWDPKWLGYEIGYGSIVLDFYFRPVTEYVLAATIANMKCLLLYRNIFRIALARCSHCGSQGAYPSHERFRPFCLSCWTDPLSASPPPMELKLFGLPLCH